MKRKSEIQSNGINFNGRKPSREELLELFKSPDRLDPEEMFRNGPSPVEATIATAQISFNQLKQAPQLKLTFNEFEGVQYLTKKEAYALMSVIEVDIEEWEGRDIPVTLYPTTRYNPQTQEHIPAIGVKLPEAETEVASEVAPEAKAKVSAKAGK